jgi:hypothetical protein
MDLSDQLILLERPFDLLATGSLRATFTIKIGKFGKMVKGKNFKG